MIVTCPSCSTRYLVDPAAIGHDGRRVKCARCGHLWRESSVEVMAAAAAAPHSVLVGPAAAQAAPAAPPGQIRNLPAVIAPRRRDGPAVGLALAVLLIGGLAGVGYFARESIVRFWPPAIRLYDTIGVPVAEPVETGALGQGLVLQELQVRRIAGAGLEQVVVTGRVENRALVTRPVPPIEVRLLDGSRTVVARSPLTVATSTLAPAQSVDVVATIETTPDAATRMEIGTQAATAP
ncbi:putative Zn finger-like uncharacterized protein [Inquilinus ginsengisoli]|uniref:Zn finger-like uncharacterized protein n=1 Tax=Inquilinus ginsengisoli TaxID=363840 RepID=A0ABU1K060_9PROT|nr:DUF3426 domain-containing protein [Inquilinus ginsengisoli]MDR6294242.1 putative Zn finger-like uncharacterized protein [Inquilinus ginsengisoli]